MVDTTNFVMAELAQPMHAFDADKLSGDTIFVRSARSEEAFHALNGETYTLDASNLVIADAEGAIGLAGVIGGMESSIGGATTRIVLESATFQAASVRRTSAAIKLRTDASIRFEKSQDPANTVRGLARAVEILRESSPGMRIVGGVADCRKEIAAPLPIELALDWLARKLGRAVPAEEVRAILERLEFGVAEPRPGVFSVTVPSWRATKDISMRDDLVEEVGRMIGYDSIAPVAPLVAATVPPENPERGFQHEARDLFVDLGFTEVYNYSFIGEGAARAFGFEPSAHVRVANPIASDQELMRASLLPGVWKNILGNAKHKDSFRLFELGLEIHKSAAGLPEEVPHLAAAIYERHGDGSQSLFELKRAAECLMPGVEAKPVDARGFEHPARAAAMEWRGRAVGRLFELHPGASGIWTGRGVGSRSRGSARVARDGTSEICAGAPLSFERVRSLGDLRLAGACRRTAIAHCGGDWSAARIGGIRPAVFGAAARGRAQKRLVPRDPRIERADAIYRRDGPGSRPHHYQDARTWLRLARLGSAKTPMGA